MAIARVTPGLVLSIADPESTTWCMQTSPLCDMLALMTSAH
jgi:hypothetical protein